MFCSIVIPTVGRLTLARAVQSVLDQEYDRDDFEVIVVNDSGTPLPMDEDSSADMWLHSDRVRVLHTQRRERCVARNTGAAVAKGRYLCFLDDDDWLLPNALADFWALACENRDAAWLYGGIRVVDEKGDSLAELNSGLNGNCFAQILGGAWAPIQASLIQTQAFFAVGGYDPAIIGTEDLDLCSRIVARGDLGNTPATVACLLRGRDWNTSTNYMRAAQDIQYSRDVVLGEPDAFKRLRASTRSSYWYGRILRVYTSTVSFNLRHRRLFAATSRALSSVLWSILAGRHVLSPLFLEGAKSHHAPGTLHFVMRTLEQESTR
jgi:glycosyltransferase involved in cell wall biosynthesis